MEAAIVARRSQAPAQIVVAVPVGARETCDRIGRMADRVVSSRRRNRSMRSASGTNSSARRAMKK
jgi:predicted phosphoribosyltransferase